MTTIQDCNYSPNHPAVSLAPLAGKIHLLQTGAAHDISRSVATLVGTHFGYKGDDVYKVRLTRTRIEFSVPGQNHVLDQTALGSWNLNSTVLSAVDAASVTQCACDILANIRAVHASSAGAPPAPIPAAAPYTGPAAPAPFYALPPSHASAAPVDLGSLHARLDELHRRIDGLMDGSRSRDLEPTIIELKKGLHALSLQIQELRDPNADVRVREMNAQAEEKLRNLENQNLELIDKLKAEHQAEIETLRAQIEQEKAAHEVVSRDQKETGARLILATAQLSTVEKQLHDLQEATKQASEKAEERIHALEADLAEAEQKAVAKVADFERHQADIIAYVTKTEAEDRELRRNNTALDRELKQLQAQDAALQLDVSRNMEASADFQRQAWKADAKLAEQTREMERLRKELAAAQASLQSGQTESSAALAGLRSELEKASAAKSLLESEHAALALNAQVNETALAALKSQLEQLQAVESAKKALETDLRSVQEKLQAAQEELKKEHIEAELQRSKRDDDVERQTAQNTLHQQENARLKAQLAEAQKGKTEIAHSQHELLAKIEAFEKEAAANSAANAQLERSLTELSTQNKSAAESAVKEVQTLRAQITALKKAEQERLIEIEDLRGHLEELKAQREKDNTLLTHQRDVQAERSAQQKAKAQAILDRYTSQ